MNHTTGWGSEPGAGHKLGVGLRLVCRVQWQRADPVEGAGCLTSENQGSWEPHHPWNLTPHPRPSSPPGLALPCPWASRSQDLPSQVKEAAPTGLVLCR